MTQNPKPKMEGMTIDKAIEILDIRLGQTVFVLTPDRRKALELSREALKGIKSVRQLHPELSPFPLSGETEG